MFDDRLKHRMPRLALASILMGVSVFALASVLPELTATLTGWVGVDGVSILGLFLLVASGGGIYAIACVSTGALRISEIMEALRPPKALPSAGAEQSQERPDA